MAQLSNSGLETTPAGTTNIAGLINGNWSIIEAWFTTVTWFWLKRIAWATTAYAATTTISFAGARAQSVSLTGNVTIAFSNLSAGRETTIFLTSDGSSRTLTWPASIIWLGTAPSSLAAGKTLKVVFFSTTSAASGVIAQFHVQP